MAWNSQRDYGNRDASARSYDNSRGGYSREREPEQKPRYVNQGALFPTRQKRSDQSPDFYGTLLLADDVLDYIVREAEGGNEVTLEMSAWSRITRDNTSITSLKINIPYAVRQAAEGNQTFRRPSYPNRGNQQTQQRLEPPRGREPQRPEKRNDYADQSASNRPIRSTQEQRERESQRRNEEFARGDRMPDFLRDDDEPPPF